MMMKNKKLPLVLTVALLLNSCVYSLFPIYTEDTIVFKKELVGKWDVDGKGSYLLFEQMGKNGEPEKEKEESDYKYSIEIKEGFTMSSDEPLFILQNGRQIFDEDSIIMIMRERLADKEEKRSEPPLDLKIKDAITKNIKEDKLSKKNISYQGSITVFEDKSYKLTVFSKDDENGDKTEEYVAHLVQIGDDLFMDLFPVKEFSSINLSDNYFPVHTFYKVSVNQDEFAMTHFDYEKLNKLFESNLIRLRHENVDGTILITAQPQELQKFIEKYSNDETVFDYTDTYKRLES